MDLRTHASVIWRWRFVVVAGLALALGLTFFSVFRVNLAEGHVAYKQGKTWQSSEMLLLTQSNCALGQITCPSQDGISLAPTVASSAAPLYAQIANSGVIRARVFPRGLATAQTGDYQAWPVTDASTGGQQLLPFLEFIGTGGNPKVAVDVSRRAASVFLAYLKQTTDSSNVPQSNRVISQVVSPATIDDAKVVAGRKLTAPIIVFLAVLIVTLVFVYVLENFFPSPLQVIADPKLAPLADFPNGDEGTRSVESEPTVVEPVESMTRSRRRVSAPADPSAKP